jgi:repressor LexA
MNVAERIANSDQRVLTAIALFWKQHGYSPSLRELCELADVSSTSMAALHLERLQAAGLIEYEPRIARSIRLVHRETA